MVLDLMGQLDKGQLIQQYLMTMHLIQQAIKMTLSLVTTIVLKHAIVPRKKLEKKKQ